MCRNPPYNSHWLVHSRDRKKHGFKPHQVFWPTNNQHCGNSKCCKHCVPNNDHQFKVHTVQEAS